jgi:hypothetical protein
MLLLQLKLYLIHWIVRMEIKGMDLFVIKLLIIIRYNIYSRF